MKCSEYPYEKEFNYAYEKTRKRSEQNKRAGNET